MHHEQYPEDAPTAGDSLVEARVWVDTHQRNSYDWTWLVGVFLTLTTLVIAAVRSCQ